MVEEAKRAFKPEFLNRIDDIVVFRSLTREHVTQILELELAKVSKRLELKGHIVLEMTDEARQFLMAKGFDSDFGARPLRRAVEKHLEDPLAEEILRGKIADSATVTVVVRDDCLVFKQSRAARKEKEAQPSS
jgi:ATP-dependent Clp protease ATP-binding subunit ClpC